MPKQSEIEVPLLEVLISLGGQGKPKEIYPLVTQKFHNITQEDLDNVWNLVETNGLIVSNG